MKNKKKLNHLHAKTMLSSAQKKHMRQRLVDVMQEHPVRIEAFDRPIEYRGKVDSAGQPLRTRFLTMKHMTVALSSLVLLCGGVGVAAQGAAPGDFLYPVKVHVNEEVSGAFHVGAQSQAQWEIERIERRISEWHALEVSGEADLDARQEVHTAIVSHSTSAQKEILALSTAGKHDEALQLSSELEILLEAYVASFLGETDVTVETEGGGENQASTQMDVMLEAQEELEDVIELKVDLTDENQINKDIDVEVQLEVEAETGGTFDPFNALIDTDTQVELDNVLEGE